jgi:hypothetical protein
MLVATTVIGPDSTYLYVPDGSLDMITSAQGYLECRRKSLVEIP